MWMLVIHIKVSLYQELRGSSKCIIQMSMISMNLLYITQIFLDKQIHVNLTKRILLCEPNKICCSVESSERI